MFTKICTGTVYNALIISLQFTWLKSVPRLLTSNYMADMNVL